MGPGPARLGPGPMADKTRFQKLSKRRRNLHEMVRRQRYGAQTQTIWRKIVVRCFLNGSRGPKWPWEVKKKLEQKLENMSNIQKNTHYIFLIDSLYVP